MSKAFFKWDNIGKLRMKPKLSFFQQETFGPVIDGFPTEPDPPTQPDVVCLQSPVTVTVVDNKYTFGSAVTKYGMSSGTYRLSVPEEHPIAFLNSGKTNAITYSGIQFIDKRAFPALDGNFGYIYVYGDVYVTVSGDFGTISYVCLYHGYEGGKDNLNYKDSCIAPPTRSVTCLNRVNDLAVTESGELKIGNNSAPYGLTVGSYTINFDFTPTESGPGSDTHLLEFIGSNSNITIQGNTGGVFSESGDLIEGIMQTVTTNVYDSFGTIGVRCLIHPNEKIDDFFIFSPTCTLPLPDDYDYVIPQPAVFIDCFLIEWFTSEVMGIIYTVCDSNGNFYEPNENTDPISPTLEISFVQGTDTFPYNYYSTTTGITYIARSIYTVVSEGDYKITDPPSGIFPPGYYLLVDVDGEPVFNTAVTPEEYIGIEWNGTAEFPLSRTGIRQAGISQVISTNVTYNIIGQTVNLIPNCRIKQPKIGTYTDDTIYLVSDANGVELDNPILVQLANTSDVKVRVFWTETDEFPTAKAPTTGGGSVQYVIAEQYKELDPVFYRAKQSKLGQYASQNVYTLVKPDGTDKMDPGTNNTTLVTITLPSNIVDQVFPIIKSPTSAYKTIDYQISSLFFVNVAGQYRLKQKIVNNLPDPNVYFIVDSNGNLVDDPGTNNTTKVEVIWSGTIFPVNLTSTNWRVNLYTIIGRYSEISGDYVMKATPTSSVDNLYLLHDLVGNQIDDPGTNNSSKVYVYWDGTPSEFPLYLNSSSGFFGITYIVIEVQFPKLVTIQEYTGPTGPVTGSTGPVTTDGFYFTENINPPSGTGATGPFTGPTTFATGAITTEATGAFEDLNTSSIKAVVGGQSSLYTLNTASEWLPL